MGKAHHAGVRRVSPNGQRKRKSRFFSAIQGDRAARRGPAKSTVRRRVGLTPATANKVREEKPRHDSDAERPRCRTIRLSFDALLQGRPSILCPLARLVSPRPGCLSCRFTGRLQVILYVRDVSGIFSVRTCRCGHVWDPPSSVQRNNEARSRKFLSRDAPPTKSVHRRMRGATPAPNERALQIALAKYPTGIVTDSNDES